MNPARMVARCAFCVASVPVGVARGERAPFLVLLALKGLRVSILDCKPQSALNRKKTDALHLAINSFLITKTYNSIEGSLNNPLLSQVFKHRKPQTLKPPTHESQTKPKP